MTPAEQPSPTPRSATVGSVLDLVPRTYDHPDVQNLVRALHAAQLALYDVADHPHDIDADRFIPPTGLFVVGYRDGVPVACGGWHRVDEQTAEIKRMFVADEVRGRGYGHTLLVELEDHARATGASRLILETGVRNHRAIALYLRVGYRRVPSYTPGRDPLINRAFSKSC